MRLTTLKNMLFSTTLNTRMTVPGLKQLVLPAWHTAINICMPGYNFEQSAIRPINWQSFDTKTCTK